MALGLVGDFLDSAGKQEKTNKSETATQKIPFSAASEGIFFWWVQSDNVGLEALVMNRWIKELPGPKGN